MNWARAEPVVGNSPRSPENRQRHAAMIPFSSVSSSTEKSIPLCFQSADRCLQSLTANILSRLPFPAIVTPPKISSPPSQLLHQSCVVSLPIILSSTSSSSSSSVRNVSLSDRMDMLSSIGKGSGMGGPAFVGQVFSMLDRSGNGLMAVTSHFDIPFISKRVPEWAKRMLAGAMKNKENGPVFRFFMDSSDAVTYVKRVNVPTGVVGACRLDVAYEHFKRKPHMFQFVPNKNQVKAANKLLRTIPNKGGKTKINGVPVFTADNLNIAIATADGIKWYAPYFFDKNLLDNILEASIDQNFHTLIHNRHMQRRRDNDSVDDGLSAEPEENIHSLFEPLEVRELLNEMGHSGVPLSIISKAAAIQLLDVVDRVLLGNKWLRKVVGIQPNLPYLVDSFEERSAACFQKTSAPPSSAAKPQSLRHNEEAESIKGFSDDKRRSSSLMSHMFPFGDWLSNSWSMLNSKIRESNPRMIHSDENEMSQTPPNPLLPKITMVGVSMGEGGQINKENLKKVVDELTKELEHASVVSGNRGEYKDPLFVANVGNYSSVSRMTSA